MQYFVGILQRKKEILEDRGYQAKAKAQEMFKTDRSLS